MALSNDPDNRELKDQIEAEILIVDDNVVSSLALKLLCKTFKVNCDIASDGTEAILSVTSKFERTRSTYQLIVMDNHMPICGGLDAAKTISDFLDQNQQRGELKPYICLLTTFPSLTDLVNLHEFGISERIVKPIYKAGVKNLLIKAGLIEGQVSCI